ncbi:MAG TPA: hypothetical protein VEW05_01220 [Candidatus Polarisedimenticolia bacterium]|nr:hypothetical protein [Candidatus Polarisedimenticolia bacterium]
MSTTIRSPVNLICDPPLGRHGARFLTSSTEAAELLKREKYHGVFLDMRMPVPDGAALGADNDSPRCQRKSEKRRPTTPEAPTTLTDTHSSG